MSLAEVYHVQAYSDVASVITRCYDSPRRAGATVCGARTHAVRRPDLDGNGYVSSRKFLQHRDARMAARAAQGRLLRNAGRAPSFESWDADDNGLLNAAEVTSGQQTRFAGRRSGSRPCCRNR